jgi:hypothetical protein
MVSIFPVRGKPELRSESQSARRISRTMSGVRHMVFTRGLGSVTLAGMKIPVEGSVGHKDKDKEKIWCPREECFKYLRVCDTCRLRIKCQNYRDYWFLRLDF